MAMVVVSSLLVRVVSPGAGGPGFRLVFEGEIVGAADAGGRHSSVTVAIAARRGVSCAEGCGTLGSVVQGRFRIESGRLGGVGDYGFRLSLDGVELSVGMVTVERVGAGFAVAGRHLVDSAVLWFDDSTAADAPMLACSFWCAVAEAGGGIADLGAVLYRNGRPVLGSGGGGDVGPGVGAGGVGVRRRPVEARLIDHLSTSVGAARHRQVQLRFPGARAFVLGEVPGVLDLSAHPGVYAIRVTRGRAVVTRVVFEIDRHGVLRESGLIECRADGTRVMLLGAGRRFGPPPAEGAATIDPGSAPFFAAARPPQRVVLDVIQRSALERVARDIAAYVVAADPAARAEPARVALHRLLTRVEELETVVPASVTVQLGREEVPFERLREIVLGLLNPPAFAQSDGVIGNA